MEGWGEERGGKEGRKEKRKRGGSPPFVAKNMIILPRWGLRAQGLPSPTQKELGWVQLAEETERRGGVGAEARALGGTEQEDGPSQSCTGALVTVWCQTGPTALPTLASPAAPRQLEMSRA